MAAVTETLAKSRRWLRFSLLTLLIVFPALGSVLGWVRWDLGQRRQEKEAAAWITRDGGSVEAAVERPFFSKVKPFDVLVTGVVADATERDLDIKRLQGTWQVVSATTGGNSFDNDIGRKWVFIGNERLVQLNSGKWWSSRYRLDTQTMPRQIFVDRRSEGIYEIDGDQLRVCISLLDYGPPPRGFSSPGFAVLYELRRDQDEDE